MARVNDKMKKQSKLRQYIGAPKRFLSKARDFYVDSMVSMDGMLSNNNMMFVTCPAPQISQILPSNKNTVPNIRDENLRRSSTMTTTRRSKGKNGEFSNNGIEGVKRSYSSVVGLGRIDTIDEDKPYECDDEDHSMMFSRSRSHAVAY